MKDTPILYRAFISYTHHDDSIKHAEFLCERMERYIIPPLLRPRTGCKMFGNVFLDCLEITYCEDGVISAFQNTLMNSDAVIALCSKKYMESKFSLEQEIAFAQRNHMRLIAVLLDGEHSLPDAFLDVNGHPLPNTVVIEWSQSNTDKCALKIIAAALNIPFGILALHETARRLLTTGYSAVIIRGCVALAGVYLAMGIFHIHIYTAATCTSPRTCVMWIRRGLLHIEQCGHQAGSALGHLYLPSELENPCTEISVCERCGHQMIVVRHEYELKHGKQTCRICGAQDVEGVGE